MNVKKIIGAVAIAAALGLPVIGAGVANAAPASAPVPAVVHAQPADWGDGGDGWHHHGDWGWGGPGYWGGNWGYWGGPGYWGWRR